MKSIILQLIVRNLLNKEIETYGILKLTEKGAEFLKKPEEFLIAEDVDFKKLIDETPAENNNIATSGAFDETLLKQLKEIRKKISKQHNIPPLTVFQDPSSETMNY